MVKDNEARKKMPASDYVLGLRDRIGHDLLLLPAVGIVAFKDSRRDAVLLVKHSDANKWVLPGGAIEPDELPADSAVREMWEETGLYVRPCRVIGVYGGPELRVTYSNRDVVSYTMIAFEAEIVSGKLKPDLEETLDLEYFTLAEVERLDSPRWLYKVLRDAFAGETETFFQKTSWEPNKSDL